MQVGKFALMSVAVAVAAQGPFSCNLRALTAVERQRHARLSEKLVAAVVTRRETERGFTFDLDRSNFTLAELEEWTELERRCCPFFDFQISLMRDGGPFSLTLEGAEGVKGVIAAEIGAQAEAGSGGRQNKESKR